MVVSSWQPLLGIWKEALSECGLHERYINDALIYKLVANNITLENLDCDSFYEFHQGRTEHEAGIAIAKEFASLDGLQAFLEPAIDWAQGWEALKAEGWLLIQTAEPETWGLFRKA